MKYVRTENGIIDVSYNNSGFILIDNEYKNIDRFKQADTIQELCDEFIIEYTEKFKRDQGPNRFRTPRRSMPFELAKNNLKIIKTLHAAIWTVGTHGEPILKSVAKLNKKTGELELL